MKSHHMPCFVSVLFILVTLLMVPITAFGKEESKGTSAPRPKVCLQPLGKHDPWLLGKASEGVFLLYGFRIQVLPRVEMPSTAWYKPRRRYRADKLLDYLNEVILPDSGCDFVLGFTSLDISTTKGKHKDWGIFGLSQVYGTASVVSTYRLTRKARSRKAGAIRTVKVVNHELGHALSQGHCGKKGCLMNDAQGTIRTVDAESGLLCDLCIGEIQRKRHVTLPKLQEFPWEELWKP